MEVFNLRFLSGGEHQLPGVTTFDRKGGSLFRRPTSSPVELQRENGGHCTASSICQIVDDTIKIVGYIGRFQDGSVEVHTSDKNGVFAADICEQLKQMEY